MNPVTYVDGLAVVAQEAGADMPWLGLRGNGTYANTLSANTLTLADGTKRYQCAIEDDCDFIGTTVQSITAGHGPKVHGTGNGGHRSRTVAAKGDIMDMPLRDFIAFAAKNGQLLSDVESWRDRALAAERRLATIERQFQ